MKQILVDMDGVLADIYAQFQQFEKQESGSKIPEGQLAGKLELDAFPNGAKHIRSKGFFRQAPPIAGSIKGLKYLHDTYRVFIVSSATEFPQSLQEKHDWLEEHFPFISWQQMIFCGSKEAIQGDIMIDDHPKNLQPFQGDQILFSQPHNAHINHGEYTRTEHWDEVIKYIDHHHA